MEPSVCREVAWAELTARVTPVEAVRSGMRGKKEKRQQLSADAEASFFVT